MPTVLAVEPDARQAAVLRQVVGERVGAEFVLAESTAAALTAIRAQVPDLVLLTALLSPRDETEVADLLRELDGAEHTQTLTIPLLALGPAPRAPKKARRGLLSAFTGTKVEATAPSGCDPSVFADEIANYLQQAEHTRAEAAQARERRAKKPRRKKREADDEASPVSSTVASSSSNYWSWDTPLESLAPVVEATSAVAEAAEPVVQAESVETADATIPAGPSSWDNPWDVSAPQDTYLDDHIIPAPDPFVAATSDTLEALLGQPVTTTAADELARAPIQCAEFITPATGQADEPSEVPEAPSVVRRAFEQLPVAAVGEMASEPEPPALPESEIVRAKLPTRAESGALLALQADVARLREQRASTDATLVAAKAAQERAARAASEAAAHAKREADRRAEEAAARAKEEAKAERLAKEAADRAREHALARAREEAAAERKARELAERRAKEETARLEREVRERQAHAEAERKAREAAEAHAAAERQARQQAEKRAREEADRVAREAERKAREEADRRAKKAEQAARDQAEALAREAEARAKEEAAVERRARQQAEQRADTERKAREASERRAEAERMARERAEQAAEAARSQVKTGRKSQPARAAKKAAPTSKRAKKDEGPRAVQDEWGLYDSHAAGFEALFAKLESIENGEAEADEPPPARAPRPLAMWVCQYEPVAETEAPLAHKGRDEFRALVSQFSIPHAVAAVSYPSGARIRRVKVPAVSTRRARSEADPRVVILSRKLLKASRRQTATERLTARR